MTSHLPRFSFQRENVHGKRVDLDAEETKHVRVRRLRPGNEVVLFDGIGRSYLGRLDSVLRGCATVVITESLPDRDGESSLDLTLTVAVLKSDRLDWVIEKTTELGVTCIRPFFSEHSIARPRANRRRRWQQIALSAAKQSARTVLPTIEAPASFGSVIGAAADRRLLFYENDASAALGGMGAGRPAPRSVVVIVGPEGGFATAEIDAARGAGFEIVSLGPRVLRAETAAIAAVALCQHAWGDLHRLPCP